MNILKAIGNKMMLGLEIVGKFLLLTPIIVMMVGINFQIDRAGVLASTQFERDIAQAMLAGEAVSNYDQMDEQEIIKQLVEVMEEPPNTIAVGSSRVLQLGREQAGTDSFLNCGVSGADYIDVMTTFYLFDKAGKLPKNLIIGVDPWLFSPKESAVNWRSDKELFNEYLTVARGVETDYVPPDPMEKFLPMFEPAYFQANLRHWFSAGEEQTTPQIVTTDLAWQNTNIKMSDGRVLYNHTFRAGDEEKVDSRARDSAATNAWLRDYSEPDAQRLAQFEDFISYVKSKDVNVIFLLTPFHPLLMNHAMENNQSYQGFWLTEPAVAEFALQNNIPIYGSYNPFVTGNTEADFYDGLHIRGEAIPAFFPGVKAVEAAQKSTKPAVSSWFNGRVRVEYITARRITAYRYEIAAPQELRRMDDEVVNADDSYILGRYDGPGKKATLLARYAVTKRDGIIYRLDTDTNTWVQDGRYAS